MDTSQDTNRAAFAKLASVIKDALYSPEVLEKIRKIGEDNHLHLDTIGDIEGETNIYLAGDITAEGFQQAITILVKDEITAKKIIKEIDEQILMPLRKKMELDSTKTESRTSSPFAEKMTGSVALPVTTHTVVDTPAPTPTTIVQQQRKLPDPYREPAE